VLNKGKTKEEIKDTSRIEKHGKHENI